MYNDKNNSRYLCIVDRLLSCISGAGRQTEISGAYSLSETIKLSLKFLIRHPCLSVYLFLTNTLTPSN